MGYHIGIDFGTSNSGVAIYDGERVRVLPIDPQGSNPQVIKTILYITREHQCLIGQEAVEKYYQHNVNRLRHFVKKWVGELDYRGSDMHYVRDVYTYVDELQPGRILQLIKTALRSPDYTGTQIFERYYELAELIGVYLSGLKQRAENLLQGKISAVTLGRPVYFSMLPEQDAKAQATLAAAAKLAGFEKVFFEFEPVAAALDYEQQLTKPQTALIFDFGGGTLDITIMRLGDAQAKTVYGSGGINIAGSDFDRIIIQKRLLASLGADAAAFPPEITELIHSVAEWMVLPELSTPLNRMNLERSIRLGLAPVRLKALQTLIFNNLAFNFYNMVEKGKIDLSDRGATTLRMQEKDIDLWELYTRHQFEQDIRHERQKIEEMILATVARANLKPAQIDVVVKTGGSSSIPVFHEMLVRLFGADRIRATDTFSSVTTGLAIRAFQHQHSH